MNRDFGRDRPVRWLTPEAKREVLREWAAIRESLGVREGRPGGRGYPDPDIVPWCDEINALEGVCTLQSCAGHVLPGGERDPGHLWLWLSKPMSGAFDRTAHRLARHDRYIEDVARRYVSWGREVTSITFAGNERASLARSLRLILAFLRTLQAQTHEGGAA